MLELSISSTGITYILLIFFATYANLVKNVRSAIMGILCAITILCLLLSSGNNTTIAIIIEIVYVSILAVFLTIAHDKDLPKGKHINYCYLICVALFASVMMITSKHPHVIGVETAIICPEIADITLLLFTIFALVLSSLISFLRGK